MIKNRCSMLGFDSITSFYRKTFTGCWAFFLLVASPSLVLCGKASCLLVLSLIGIGCSVASYSAHKIYSSLHSDNHRLVICNLLILFGFFSAYMVLHPLVDEDWLSIGKVRVGPSDADDAIDVFIDELSAGRYPYYARTFLNNPLTPMPGQILLSLPFYLLGDSGLQNIFWLSVLVFFLNKRMDSSSAPFVSSLAFLLGSPIVIYQVIQGTDYLSNSIYVLVATTLFYEAISADKISSLRVIIVSLFLGVTLASRFNFVLVLPLLFFQLLLQVRIRLILAAFFIVALVSAALVLPFLLYDPFGFTPLHTASKITAGGLYPFAPLVPVALVLLASLVRVLLTKGGNLILLLRNIFYVQLEAIISGFIGSSIANKQPDFFSLHYLTLVIPLGLLPFADCCATRACKN